MRATLIAFILAFTAAAAAQERKPDEVLSALVAVKAQVGADARRAATLGRERRGSGTIIRDGLVLTIGYLVVEAETIELTDAGGRSVPATVAAYDHATGFGLLKAIGPLAGKPLALGDPATLAEKSRAMVVTASAREDATLVTVVSRRPFYGSWEYQLDAAIYTYPPVPEWSGAPLIGGRGELLGVGSLVMAEAGGPGSQVPGNLFVPVDILRPILEGLIRSGKRSGPQRPWLGVNAEEVRGHLFVSRLSPEGPGERAGLKTGDIILAVGGEEVTSLEEFYRRVWSRGAAGVEVPLQVLQGAKLRELRLRSIDRAAYFKPSKSY